MKFRFPLYLQAVSMLFLYLGALLVVVAVCFNAQFGVGWDALLKSPVGDRVDTIADAIVSQLHSSPTKNWNGILKEFDDIYHVQFYAFDIFNKQLAGDPITLPRALTDRNKEMAPVPLMHHFGNHRPHYQFFARERERERAGSQPNQPPPDGEGPPPFDRPPPPPDQSAPFSDRPPMPPDQSAPTSDRPPMPPDQSAPFSDRPPMPPDQAGPSTDRPPPPPGLNQPRLPSSFFMHAHGRFIVHTQQPDRFWIGTRVDLFSTDSNHPVPGVILAASDNIWQTSLLFDVKFAAIVFATILLLSILFWWPFIFRITHAMSALTRATERIAEGRFDTRLKSKRIDEIGRLSDAVNKMAERLSNFVSGQKRFLGDISHELFSPLARLQLALELLKSSSSEEQLTLIADIEEEATEMNNLINELLAFSKASLKEREPELTAVNLRTLIEGVVSRLNQKDSIEIDVPAALQALADPLLLERSISNVIRNSIRYAGELGPITVSASRLQNEIAIVITDNGPGVPEEALKHLSEPFFRPEAARTRNSGGVGLGLAIVKTCVEACGGSLILNNRVPKGFVVEIRLQPAK